VARFAAACTRAAQDATAFEMKAADLQRSCRGRVTPVRANSASDLLLGELVGAPVLTVGTAAALIGRNFPATNAAVRRLAEPGIPRQSRGDHQVGEWNNHTVGRSVCGWKVTPGDQRHLHPVRARPHRWQRV
jgi:hypothetical protein